MKVPPELRPAFYLQHGLPEVDQLNFAPRVKAPVLFKWPR